MVAFAACFLLTACSTPTPPAARASIPTNAVGDYVNPFRIGRPLVIAHAGGDAMFPENTLVAYEQSVALGGDVIDIDVWVTRDGVPVAMHDSTVDRTTETTGKVSDMTAEQVIGLDAGHRFERDGAFPYRGQGVTVPTVESILRRFGDRLVTLDMKDRRVSSAAPVCGVIRELGLVRTVYVGIDVNEQVLAFRRACPEVFTSGTSDERQLSRAARDTGDATFRSNQLVSQPGFVGSDGVRRVTAESLAFAHRSGTAVLTWIIDDRAQMEELIDLGVDGIYTRHPDVLVDVLRSRGLLPASPG